MIQYKALEMIAMELSQAQRSFPKFRSPHEGWAIITEELDELKEEVFKQHEVRDKEVMRDEAKQVAAMAMRFMVDLT